MRKVKSKSREFNCSLCSDSKHVFSPESNSWLKCNCLIEEQKNKNYKRAGVPVRFFASKWRDILKEYKVRTQNALTDLISDCDKMSKGEVQSNWFSVFSHSHQARSLVQSLVLKSACDGGIDCAVVTIRDLIDFQFDSSEKNERCLQFPVLLIVCGNEPSHKYNQHSLESVLKSRWEKQLMTLLICETAPDKLATIYGSDRIGEFVTEDFREIRLDPK